jgi:hypothetical protein
MVRRYRCGIRPGGYYPHMGTGEQYPCCAQSRTERNTGIDDARGVTASRGSLRDNHRSGALIIQHFHHGHPQLGQMSQLQSDAYMKSHVRHGTRAVGRFVDWKKTSQSSPVMGHWRSIEQALTSI